MGDQAENQKFLRKIQIFKSNLETERQENIFKDIFKKNNGNWPAIKSELLKEEGFTHEIINSLEFTHHLAEWSNENEGVISIFQKDHQVNSMRDIAMKYNKATFIEKIKNVIIVGSEEEKTAFTLNLYRMFFYLKPTEMLIRMIRDPQIAMLNNAVGANVAMILEKQPDFNIKTTSIYEVIKNKDVFKDIPLENHETVITQLKTLQRITAISPDPDALPVLYNANLHSAMQISTMPKKQFMAMMSKSGLDDNILTNIYNSAQQACVRNEQAIIALREVYKGTDVAMIDKSMSIDIDDNTKDEAMNLKAEGKVITAPSIIQETLTKHNLSWDLLFGDADFCECDHCNSVYSAAAYYVELLQYLRNNNLDPDHRNSTIEIKINPKDISGTPLEKLFDRRPDLGCLELTCKNINTVLPYIDLVNEIMENYVAFKYLKSFNVKDESSSELLAEPQHTEYQAYCILKKEVYPFMLPYHQPIDAARIYLKHLDTSRYELINTFRKNNLDNDEELTVFKDEALDRAADAEFLGLTKEEYVILTKESFEKKALVDKLKNKIHTDAEYQQLIGVKPVCKYYGFDDNNIMLGDDGLALIKKEFLRRTGIDYVNLVDLLKTRYINPYTPKGKSKTIMESLHFSYRFLQNYASVYGVDKMAEDLVKGQKLSDLLPLFKELIETLTNSKALRCSKANQNQTEISDKDIIHWMKCHFKRVGKMIVIESGIGCMDGKFTKANEKKFDIKDCKIFACKNDEKIHVGSIDKRTGEVSLREEQTYIYESDLKDLSFDGDKGEKGIFLVINHKIYLVFSQRKDSCDLDTALLQHLDGTPLTIEEYDRIHRFIRLWRKLGWTIDETDQAIADLSNVITQDSKLADNIWYYYGEDDCNSEDCYDGEENTDMRNLDINPNLIHQLVAVKRMLDKTGLELIKLLSFWSDISTKGEKSLYQRLFLTHNVLGVDKVFEADDKGDFLTTDVKLLEHVPGVMASLNLSYDDIFAIMKATGMDDKLTLDNLSVLYRYRILSKVLGMRVPAFISILVLYGDIFKDAHATLEFMNITEKIEKMGFTHKQLNYIILDVDDEKKPFAPAERDVLKLSKTLYDGLNAIDESHKDIKADLIKAEPEDPELQKTNIQEQATSALIRTKTSLLFETEIVEKIVGILEGTNVYIANAPKNLEFTLPDTSTLKNKLKYDKILGTIQITGILTESEKGDYKAISPGSDWAKALACIESKQNRLFKEVLSGIFENEQTKTECEKTKIERIIKSGDIKIPLDKISKGEEDHNTIPQKRVAFLEIFLPYLRQQLSYRFVIDTLVDFTGLDAKITEVLVSKVLRQKLTSMPIYNIFKIIRESNRVDETSWKGYLIPAVDAKYTFIIKNGDTKPTVSIDGNILDLIQEDSSDDCMNHEWWSKTKTLQAGKLYKLHVSGVEFKNIFWKTPVSAVGAIPSSALIPDFASKQCKQALITLKKAAILVSTFDLSADEIQFLNLYRADFGGLDFNEPKLGHWLRIEGYIRLRNSLPQAKLNLLEFWNWIYRSGADKNKQLIDKIVDLTTWKKERIEKLIAEDHFNIDKLEDYRNEKNLLKLQKALTVADKIGVDIDLLFQWAVPVSKFNTCCKIADSIKNAIRAKYDQSDWEQVIKPLHDKLRNNQKDALIGHLLQQKELIDWNVIDADGLFEYFLIDVQMDACMETSRIKQAISSVQLFVQRCFLGLEEEHNGIKSGILDRPRWDWMQRYRVWEANRKVFLYPENWIESNLRDDKSPFFKELESELLQKDINKQNVTDALKSYLYKVDEVANMEVVGLYIDGIRVEKEWSKDAKLHVFSRTRNSPYFFYYRYLALDEMNWYPWEKMQIDIPSYDVEDSTTHEVTDNGCYLTPVVWNNRLLVFFPQIMKKIKPNSDVVTGSFNSLGNDSTGINKSEPIHYYEIKMAWSEYRNGKWTQKQLSNNVLKIDKVEGRRIDQFTFFPKKSDSNIIIHIEEQVADDKKTYKGFTFTGSMIEDDKEVNKVEEYLPTTINLEFGTTETVFQKASNNIQSLQLNKDLQDNNGDTYLWGNDDATFRVNRNTVLFNYVNTGISSCEFYHAHTSNLLNRINLNQLEEFFKYNQSMPLDSFGPFDHDDNSVTKNIYHELKRPYSLYNWELFFHTPILLADSLSKAQQFEEAMKWFHFVFNPIASGDDLTEEKINKRFWQFKPFREIDSKRILNSIFNNLAANTKNDRINEWRNKPFMPHVVARSRPVAYMKWVVMKYIDNLLAWGDYLFRQDTIETINQATQLYVLAGHILGTRPMMIPKRGKIKPKTYLGLLDKWDAFSNAMVELELTAPFSNQTTLPIGKVNKELVFANIFGLASSLYFCIPNNPKLMGYWDTLADRLYKIRHCQNIKGVFRKLPLFEPPIDPALLVRAAAQGLSIASVLNDLNTPMPNYRFYYLLQKALELCNELKSLGGAMLSAIEKKDNETIALISAKHEGVMQNLVMEIKKKQVEEAQKNIEGLTQNRKTLEARMKYYLKLSGQDESLVPTDTADFNGIPNEIVTVDGDSGLKLIPFEKEEMDKAGEARLWQVGIGSAETLSSILHIIPSFQTDAEPFGIGMSSVITSGWMLGNAAQAVARGLQVYANDLTYQSTNAGRKGGFQRALQERIFQANAAGYELKQIDKQITVQEIRMDIANQEIKNQQRAIDNANEVEEFIKNKYSNEELYTWMRGSLKTLYHQVYNLAYDLAKKAEKTYCFERGISSANFIQSGYFDAGRDGLLAGEQLYVGLKQLEAAYQNERGYEYEITKQISLYQINPLAIMQLRATGKCEFALPEVLFDLDYPGHYKRRIKSISVSMPCIVGPYTGINATLSLLQNKFRNTAISGKAYEEDIEEADERFSSYTIPINAIAASSAQNDSGMFELNFKDERYLPFEGAGVISKWCLELPTFRQFDYHSISDVIIHLKYTACEGGEKLKLDAIEYSKKWLKDVREELNETGLQVALNMKHDMPNEWLLLKKNGTVNLSINKSRLPYIAQTMNFDIENVMFLAKAKENSVISSVKVNGDDTNLNKIDELKLYRGSNSAINLDEPFSLSVDSTDLNNFEELMLIVKYKKK
ncbi:neuraminidase-like domain-containing protein [Wukongibacter sp. M2B1]|uniref:Tc toxin subunit A-related protein n=1 Tax=Wukongibacter sp. M2B1 TaxID=3088895 RepID=UPI003D7A36BD